MQWQNQAIVDVISSNKVADHASITTDIATVVEKILHEDWNKAIDSDGITDPTEGIADEAIGQAMMENDDMYATDEEIVLQPMRMCRNVYRIPPPMDINHEMKYLTKNPHCSCDRIEHDRRIGFQCRINEHIFLKYLLVESDICLDV